MFSSRSIRNVLVIEPILAGTVPVNLLPDSLMKLKVGDPNMLCSGPCPTNGTY